MDFPEGSHVKAPRGSKYPFGAFLVFHIHKIEKRVNWAIQIYCGVFILRVSFAGDLPSFSGETHFQLTTETKLVVALSVGQADFQKLVPTPFQGTNISIVFIYGFLIYDDQGKPDKCGVNRYKDAIYSPKLKELGNKFWVDFTPRRVKPAYSYHQKVSFMRPNRKENFEYENISIKR